jgi:hypothetical protein
MEKTLTINLEVRTTPPDADDASGFVAREGGCFPQPGSGPTLVIAVPTATRPQVPGPPPVDDLDAQGFLMMEKYPAGGVGKGAPGGGGGPGNTWGDLGSMATFVKEGVIYIYYAGVAIGQTFS